MSQGWFITFKQLEENDEDKLLNLIYTTHRRRLRLKWFQTNGRKCSIWFYLYVFFCYFFVLLCIVKVSDYDGCVRLWATKWQQKYQICNEMAISSFVNFFCNSWCVIHAAVIIVNEHNGHNVQWTENNVVVTLTLFVSFISV